MNYDMTKQEIFDTVVMHLYNQGQQSAVYDDWARASCRYRTPEGLKCAVGCLIPDKDYNTDMEGTRVPGLLIDNIKLHTLFVRNMDLLMDLQSAHDNRCHWDKEGPTIFLYNALTLIAKQHDLDIKVLQRMAG